MGMSASARTKTAITIADIKSIILRQTRPLARSHWHVFFVDSNTARMISPIRSGRMLIKEGDAKDVKDVENCGQVGCSERCAFVDGNEGVVVL